MQWVSRAQPLHRIKQRVLIRQDSLNKVFRQRSCQKSREYPSAQAYLPDREMSRRLGVSTHCLYKWMQPFAEPASKAGCMAAELAAALPWLLLFWFWQAMDG